MNDGLTGCLAAGFHFVDLGGERWGLRLGWLCAREFGNRVGDGINRLTGGELCGTFRGVKAEKYLNSKPVARMAAAVRPAARVMGWREIDVVTNGAESKRGYGEPRRKWDTRPRS